MGVAPLTQIIQRRLKISLANWPPIVDELLRERLGLYPNPLFALETADQLKSQGIWRREENHETNGENKIRSRNN
jgi:hypothetical protein